MTKPEGPEAMASNVAEIEVYRAAKQMIDYYDNEAAIRSALRADTLLRLGDTQGSVLWKRIVEAIKAIQDIGTDKPVD
jgi:hypothetical protein